MSCLNAAVCSQLECQEKPQQQQQQHSWHGYPIKPPSQPIPSSCPCSPFPQGLSDCSPECSPLTMVLNVGCPRGCSCFQCIKHVWIVPLVWFLLCSCAPGALQPHPVCSELPLGCVSGVFQICVRCSHSHKQGEPSSGSSGSSAFPSSAGSSDRAHPKCVSCSGAGPGVSHSPELPENWARERDTVR